MSEHMLEWILVGLIWGWAIAQLITLYLLSRQSHETPPPVDPKVTEVARKNFEEMARLGLERYRVLKGSAREKK